MSSKLCRIQLISSDNAKLYKRTVSEILTGEPVEVKCIEWKDALRYFQEIRPNKIEPDIMQIGHTWVKHFAKKGIFADSFPWFHDPMLLFYRIDHLSSDNLLTKKSFLQLCTQLKESKKTKHTLGLIAHREWYLVHSFISWFWGMGGEIHVNKFGKIEYDELFIKSINFYIDLLKNFSNPHEQTDPLKPISYPVMWKNFASKKDFSMFISGLPNVFKLTERQKQDFFRQFGVSFLPTTDNVNNHIAFLGGSFMCIAQKDYQEEEIRVIERCISKLMSTDGQFHFCTKTGNIPSETKARNMFASYCDNTYNIDLYNLLEKVISKYKYYDFPVENETIISSALSAVFHTKFGGFESNSSSKLSELIENYGIKPRYEYDVAISFAGENRDVAQKIYKELTNRNIEVYYDEQICLLGENIEELARRIYGGKSRFVLPIISKYYPIKDWTRFEFEISLKEANRRGESYILPCIIEDVSIVGLSKNVGNIDLQKMSIEEAVEQICRKVKLKS